MKKIITVTILICLILTVFTGCGADKNGYTEDTEYYLYFGLNDKDTGEQIYTKEQANEKIESICVNEGIGFTRYEAYGAYLDNSKPITNETAVFMMIMVTEEQAENVAEKAKAELNLASILIVKKPVSYKFV